MKTACAAAAGLLALSWTSCAKSPGRETAARDTSTASTEALSRQVGDFLPLRAGDEAYACLVNNLGMSGSEGRFHGHNNDSAAMYAGEKRVFVFDLGHTEALGELYLWNYNAAGATDSGLREVEVAFSEDGAAYTSLGVYTLAQAAGGESEYATNTVDGGVIDFDGRPGRFIRLSPVSNWGGGAWGLSEVRLYRWKQEVREGALISAAPIERYNNKGAWLPLPESYNLTSGAGLSDRRSAEALHDADPAHMLSISTKETGFRVDLKGMYPVAKIVLWNYNDSANLDWGVKKVRVKISSDGLTWRTVEGVYEVPQGTGAALPPSLVITPGTPYQTRYLLIESLENWGGERTGLSAMRCYTGGGWFVDDAPDWTALFSSYDGWSGADGIYSVNLNGRNDDAETSAAFFVFSDTIISQVDPVTGRRGGVYLANNTSAVLHGRDPLPGALEFHYPDKTAHPAMIQPEPSEPSSFGADPKYYWLGDTFVVGNVLYVFALKIDHVDPGKTGFGFAQTGVDLARYDIVDGAVDYDSLRIIADTEGRLCGADEGGRFYFGGAVLENTASAGAMNPDGWYYVYGYYDTRNAGRKLVAARVRPEEIENFPAWEYLSADDVWTPTLRNPKFLANDVAPEVSVSEIRTGANAGKYLLTNTHYTIGNEIKVSIAASPGGEFQDKTTVFIHDTTNAIPGAGNNSYNAKAHPALSSDRELLISYNVNGDDCFTLADIYRPRFVRLAMVPGTSE